MNLGVGVLIVAASCAGFASCFCVLMCARVLEDVRSSIYVSAALAFVLLPPDASMQGTNI